VFEHAQVIPFLTALGDRARLDIVLLLGDHGRLNVTEIAHHFPMSRPAISHHLKVLKDARILKSEKIGQEVFYWLDCPTVVARLRAIADLVDACKTAQSTTP
jgi:DNA-binding transcriptional ArsR family regulator